MVNNNNNSSSTMEVLDARIARRDPDRAPLASSAAGPTPVPRQVQTHSELTPNFYLVLHVLTRDE